MATDKQGATLKKSIASLLSNDEFSDMTITVRDNKVFKVHKAVICTQSKVFYNACTNNFKKETKDANIDLSEQDPEAVEALIEYLYKCNYTRLTKDNINALIIHVHVYQLANMYFIEELKEVAGALFKEAVETDWNLPAFPLAIQEIYANPEGDDKTLRKLVVEHTVDNIENLLKDDEGEFAQTMSAFGEFGKDVSRELMSFAGPIAKRGMVSFYCGINGYYFNVNLRKASVAFKANPICVCGCNIRMNQQTSTVSANYDQICQSCGTVVSTSNHSGQSYSLNCPSCNCQKQFKRT